MRWETLRRKSLPWKRGCWRPRRSGLRHSRHCAAPRTNAALCGASSRCTLDRATRLLVCTCLPCSPACPPSWLRQSSPTSAPTPAQPHCRTPCWIRECCGRVPLGWPRCAPTNSLAWMKRTTMPKRVMRTRTGQHQQREVMLQVLRWPRNQSRPVRPQRGMLPLRTKGRSRCRRQAQLHRRTRQGMARRPSRRMLSRQGQGSTEVTARSLQARRPPKAPLWPAPRRRVVKVMALLKRPRWQSRPRKSPSVGMRMRRRAYPPTPQAAPRL